MTRTLQTFRFVSKSFAIMCMIGFLSILATVVATNVIFYLTDRYDSVMTQRTIISLTAPLEITSGLFALLTGLVLVVGNFKVALANGISRKTYWLANLPAALLTALTLTIFNQIIVVISAPFLPVQLVTDMIFPISGWLAKMVFQVGGYTLLIALGWFITLLYYRASVPLRWVISIAPFILLRELVIILRQIQFTGSTLEVLLNATLGTPSRSGLTFLVIAAILSGLVYLLLRRAPLQD